MDNTETLLSGSAFHMLATAATGKAWLLAVDSLKDRTRWLVVVDRSMRRPYTSAQQVSVPVQVLMLFSPPVSVSNRANKHTCVRVRGFATVLNFFVSRA